MLVSLKWLRDYVDLPMEIDVEEIARQLTMSSAEVDAVHRVGSNWDRALITVGEVLTVEAHPDADRLRLATVNYGSAEPQRVVCGAPNLTEGQKVAFGREGANLCNPQNGKWQRLKAAKIRGIESAGMVLSEAELGLSQSHDGIIELPADAPVGAALVDYLGDVVLDVHIWPNRADMMSMLGIAREIGAILGVGVHAPDLEYPEGPEISKDTVHIEIEDPSLCSRYVATVVDGIKVGPSPPWLQERLIAAGQRPINNVVDITNFVMFELGQPLHAFDLDALGSKVCVRTAKTGETLRTLDEINRELTSETLLITNEAGPIGLAGVMGGSSTEVSTKTTSILLEAARFDPVSVRRTSTRLALRSEASSRFERGLSPELAERAARRATKLFVELCDGKARSGLLDIYPRPHVAPVVEVTRTRLDTLIGFHVPSHEVEKIFDALGFEMLSNQSSADSFEAKESFRVRAPWWRTDIAIADDLVEEIVRLAGYERLPATTIRGRTPEWEPTPTRSFRDDLRDAMTDAGWQEVITYSLTSDEVLARVISTEHMLFSSLFRVENALSSDRKVLRPTLRHALLEVIDHNIRGGAEEVAIFETARVYLPQDGEPQPEERDYLVAALAGFEIDRWGRATSRPLDFFDAKGAIDQALRVLGFELSYEAGDEFAMISGRVARLSIDGDAVGVLGEMEPEVLKQFGIDQQVTLFELDLEKALAHANSQKVIASVPRFPAVEQDVAVIVDEQVPAGAMRTEFENSPLVKSATPFDVYRGDQLPDGKKSVAISVNYQAPNRTLTQEDADREQAKILKRLKRQFGAELR